MSGRIFDPDHSPIAGKMLLEASAGTGKTYALERIVARLLFRKERPLQIDQILVLTFTNRAAREMKERIRRILGQFIQDEQRSEFEKRRCREALSNFDKSAISTIHSFCRRVLETWPFEASAPFQQELLPGSILEREVVNEWLASREIKEDMFLRAAYRRVNSIETMMENIVLGLKQSIAGVKILPDEDEIADFRCFAEESLKTESEFMLRAGELLKTEWSGEAYKTLIGLSGGPKKTAASLAKISSHMKICSTMQGIEDLGSALFTDPAGVGISNHFDQLLASALLLENKELCPDDESKRLFSALKSLLNLLDPYIDFRPENRKNKIVSLIDQYMESAFYDEACRQAAIRIAQRKNENGIWDYDDLINKVSEAVNAEDSPLRMNLRQRYRAILIDEFQDSDPRQWSLFQSVFDSPNHLMVLIGDPKQSIYGFRGSGLQIYKRAKKFIPEKNHYRLDTNYRSRKALVDLVNNLFDRQFSRSADTTEPIGYQKVNAGLQIRQELLWPKSEYPLALFPVSNEADGAMMICHEIRKLLDPLKGAVWRSETDNNEEHRLQASEIAVLVRKARAEDDIIARLADLGVPALRFRSRSVFCQPIVQALTGLLEAFENPQDSRLWRTVLLGDFFSLPADLLVSLEEKGCLDGFAEQGPQWKALFQGGQSTRAFEDFFEYSRQISRWARESDRQCNYLQITWPQRALRDGMSDWQDWRQLIELIQKKESQGLRDISGLLEWIRQSAEVESMEGSDHAVRLETESPAVRVMTMHSAKGLEFPLVFLHGGYGSKTKRSSTCKFNRNGSLHIDRLCREENFMRSLAYNWEEDKRLWYVAFTRASYKVWSPILVGEEKAAAKLDSFWQSALISESNSRSNTDSSEVTELPLHEWMTKKEIGDLRDTLYAKVNAVPKGNPLIHIIESDDSNLESLPSNECERSKNSLTPPRPAHWTGTRDPYTASYSSIIRHIPHTFLPDQGEWDEIADEEAVKSENPLDAEFGAVFGTVLHAFLEESDFGLAAADDKKLWLEDQQMDDAFSNLAVRYYPAAWYKIHRMDLLRLMRNALRCPIPRLGRLCDLQDSEHRSEIAFQISIPESGQISLKNESLTIDKGFLKGFIDLLVHKDGRWWVIDWKTNLPIHNGRDWDESRLETMMSRNHYHLQYELYFLALCRSLSCGLGRPVDWEGEIGEAVYLFLRGLNENDASGIYSRKPAKQRMKSLAQSMGIPDCIV